MVRHATGESHPSMAVWHEGHRTGSVEGFQSCIAIAVSASSLEEAVERMRKEVARRYPDHRQLAAAVNAGDSNSPAGVGAPADRGGWSGAPSE